MYSHHEHLAPGQHDPCQYLIRRGPNQAERATGETSVDYRPCNAAWSSVLHPPNQYRHWCAILESGGDCGHLEF